MRLPFEIKRRLWLLELVHELHKFIPDRLEQAACGAGRVAAVPSAVSVYRLGNTAVGVRFIGPTQGLDQSSPYPCLDRIEEYHIPQPVSCRCTSDQCPLGRHRSNSNTSASSVAVTVSPVSSLTAAPSPAANAASLSVTAPRATCIQAWRPGASA